MDFSAISKSDNPSGSKDYKSNKINMLKKKVNEINDFSSQLIKDNLNIRWTFFKLLISCNVKRTASFKNRLFIT